MLAVTESATVHKLLSNLMQTVAEAKAEDDVNRSLPPAEPQPVMLPTQAASQKRPREEFSADLDDEIPF